MIGRVMAVLVTAAVGTVVATACSSSGGNVVRTVSPPPVTSPATSPTSTSPAASSSATVAPAVTVTPSRGLAAAQTVQVHATGFSANEALQIVQCAAKQAATGPGDCNLASMQAVTSDAQGTVTAQLRVVRGPFGANRIVCGATQPCLVSVTQASLSPTEEADAAIVFAATPAGAASP